MTILAGARRGADTPGFCAGAIWKPSVLGYSLLRYWLLKCHRMSCPRLILLGETTHVVR